MFLCVYMFFHLVDSGLPLAPSEQSGGHWGLMAAGLFLCVASFSPGSPWSRTSRQPKVQHPKISWLISTSRSTSNHLVRIWVQENMFSLPHLRVWSLIFFPCLLSPMALSMSAWTISACRKTVRVSSWMCSGTPATDTAFKNHDAGERNTSISTFNSQYFRAKIKHIMSWEQNLLYGVTSHKDNQPMGIHQMCRRKDAEGVEPVRPSHSPPPHHSGRSECRVCAGPCPDTPAAARTGTGSGSALSDSCWWSREGSSPTPPAGRHQWEHLETNLHPHSPLPICILGSHSSKHKICDQMWCLTSVSQSSSLTALSVTCRSISWVQILSLESSRISFLTASSTVAMDSVLSMMNVERCYGGNRGSLINI